MRLTLDILEATSLLHAAEVSETALHLRLKDARKKNNSNVITDTACQLADLAMAKRKLEEALASETRTNHTPIAKSGDA